MSKDKYDDGGRVFGGAAIRGVSVKSVAGCGFLRVGEDFAVADDFLATVIPEDGALPLCYMRISFEDGKPSCSELRLERRGKGIGAETMRKLPLGSYIREAVAHAAFRFTRDRKLADKARNELGGEVGKEREIDGEPAWIYREPGRSALSDILALRDMSRASRRQPRRGLPLTDDDLRGVASIYEAALRANEPPVVAVMDEFHVSRATASRWVAKAREREFLVAGYRGSDA